MKNILCKIGLHDTQKETYEKHDEYYYIVKYKCNRCGKKTFKEINTTPFKDLSKK